MCSAGPASVLETSHSKCVEKATKRSRILRTLTAMNQDILYTVYKCYIRAVLEYVSEATMRHHLQLAKNLIPYRRQLSES